MAPAKKSNAPDPVSRVTLDELAQGARALQSELVRDGVINSKTGIGTSRDKGQSVSFVSDFLDLNSARMIYSGSDIAARIVDLPAKEMTRRGWEVKIPGDKTTAKKATTKLADLKTKARISEAIRKKRGFGGALIMINVTDGVTDPSLPINMDNLQSVDSLTVFEPGEASAMEYSGNPVQLDYAEPVKWQISPRATSADASISQLFLKGVHPSRVFRISDAPLSRMDINRNFGFGPDSVLSRVHRVIARVDQNYASSGALVDDFAQAVFKIKGLYKSMINDKGAGARARLKMIDEYRSVLRGIVLDGDGEDFVRQPTPLTGLPELLDRFAARLAMAADMPISVLFGKSPSGLAASGDMDVRMWYDTIASAQELEVEPVLSHILGLIFKSKKGPTNGKIPEDWEISFKALWQPTDKENSDRKLVDSQTRQNYFNMGALDSEQIQSLIRDEFGLDADDDASDAEDLEEEEGATAAVDPDGKPIQAPAGAPTPKPGGVATPGGENVQAQALNGAQVVSMIDIVKAVAGKEIPRQSGVAIMMRAFMVSKADAEELIGPDNFEPKPEPAPVSPFGGAPKPPGAPAPKPPAPAKPDEE